MKVAVIFGGDSNEREISLESGRNIFYKLSSEKYTAIPLFMDGKRHLYKITEDILANNATHGVVSQLTDAMRIRWSDLPTVADFVFLGLHGGAGENGCIQGALEMLGIPYNGSS